MTRMRESEALRGRGTAWNPANRFDGVDYVPDPDGEPPDCSAVGTQYFPDRTQSILSQNESPDVPFEVGLNPYRGCEHGCVYCFARPFHEYLGYSAGLDFETKILVKHDAPALLRKALSAKSWKPQTITMSGATDAYQPIEHKLRITRGCLEVLCEFRNPVAIVTKNRLVARDADLLADLAQDQAAMVYVSLTTLDLRLNRILEPRTSAPAQRLEAIRALSQAGVPVGVMLAPMIPGINDHEMPALLQAAADAGATTAGYIVLRLPLAVAPLFERWLEQHYPDRKDKVLNRLRAMRGGELYQSKFGERMRGRGETADLLAQLFDVARRKAGMGEKDYQLSTAAFRKPGPQQMALC
jgi:DNA repair photolyase